MYYILKVTNLNTGEEKQNEIMEEKLWRKNKNIKERTAAYYSLMSAKQTRWAIEQEGNKLTACHHKVSDPSQQAHENDSRLLKLSNSRHLKRTLTHLTIKSWPGAQSCL